MIDETQVGGEVLAWIPSTTSKKMTIDEDEEEGAYRVHSKDLSFHLFYG